jgi:hypothetical protein
MAQRATNTKRPTRIGRQASSLFGAAAAAAATGQLAAVHSVRTEKHGWRKWETKLLAIFIIHFGSIFVNRSSGQSIFICLTICWNELTIPNCSPMESTAGEDEEGSSSAAMIPKKRRQEQSEEDEHID